MYDCRSHDYVVHDRIDRYLREAEAKRLARACRDARRLAAGGDARGLGAAIRRLVSHRRSERISVEA